jgi:short-subunit dehydrogenase
MQKVIFVTGASSGLGLAAANAFHAQGHLVYGSSRDIKRLQGVTFHPIEMDVTDDTSVEVAIEKIIVAEGRIDVLINNAGNTIAGPLYNIPVAFAEKQMEVNFFGVVRVSSVVLPRMIEKKRGLVIYISSLAGLFGLPYQGLYSASKFAVEGYAESLRMELQHTGIKVVVVNPGDFKTAITDNRVKVPFTLNNKPLQNEFDTALTIMEGDERGGANPDKLAAQLCKIVASNKPAQRYLVGSRSQTIVPLLKRILPGSIFVKLMNQHYGIK